MNAEEQARLDLETRELSLYNRKQRLVSRIDEAINDLDHMDLHSKEMRKALDSLQNAMSIDSDKLKLAEMELVRQRAYKIAELATVWISVEQGSGLG
jgi:hypothetical protein